MESAKTAMGHRGLSKGGREFRWHLVSVSDGLERNGGQCVVGGRHGGEGDSGQMEVNTFHERRQLNDIELKSDLGECLIVSRGVRSASQAQCGDVDEGHPPHQPHATCDLDVPRQCPAQHARAGGWRSQPGWIPTSPGARSRQQQSSSHHGTRPTTR